MKNDGPMVEGRVVAALLDLWDWNDDYLDQNSDFPVTFSQIWASGLNAQTDETFEEFWDYMKANVLTKPQAYRGIKSIQNNTITTFTGVMSGDCNADDLVNLTDAIYLINYIFGGGPPPTPYLLVGDTGCNGICNIGDPIRLIGYIFGGDPPPCTFE